MLLKLSGKAYLISNDQEDRLFKFRVQNKKTSLLLRQLPKMTVLWHFHLYGKDILQNNFFSSSEVKMVIISDKFFKITSSFEKCHWGIVIYEI